MKTIRLFAAFALALVLASCGGDDDDDDSEPAGTGGTTAADAGDLPPGPYTESCRDCTVDANTLSCQCLTDAGFYQNTSRSPATCDEGFVNCDGILYCGSCL